MAFQTLGLVCLIGSATSDGTIVPGVNRIETYHMRWWGAEGSERDRPTYTIAMLGNGRLSLRYSIVPGRPLSDYTLPYWRIASGFSIVDQPAELAHQCEAVHRIGDSTEALNFVPHSGFDLANLPDSDVFRIRNRTATSPEGREKGSANPLLMEYCFIVVKDSPTVQVLARFTNSGTAELHEVAPRVFYEQRFNWSDLGISKGESYLPIENPSVGSTSSFYAFSKGMRRGYEILASEGCHLVFAVEEDWNRWEVSIGKEAVDLKPGESIAYRYQIRVLRDIPRDVHPDEEMLTNKVLECDFRHILPDTFRKAPVDLIRRVSLRDLLGDLDRPKIRGLNLRGSFPQVLSDLDTLEEWGGNLAITSIGDPDQTAQLIEKGHHLGMEMFLAGMGGYTEGPPSFDPYYSEPRPKSQHADSHGQDEDHYYWNPIPPTRDFEKDFGKPMALATQEERVLYWASCYRDKWLRVLDDGRKVAAGSGVWFYTPSPGVAHVDPLDFHDLFFRKIAEIGEPLTVFPFYYGIEYNQAEYMVRRWKDAGAARVVFLPMSDFLSLPSQYFRVITAARRGGADGACGFNFYVGEEEPGKEWQWKSVLLASEANFPTSERAAYCLVEEPAELIEAMTTKAARIDLNAEGFQEEVAVIADLFPNAVAENEMAGILRCVVDETDALPSILHDSERSNWRGKGFIDLADNVVRITGPDREALIQALALFQRYVSLARVESENLKTIKTYKEK